MKAAALEAPRRIAIVDKPEAEPGPGEVRVRIEACGLCGTDLHFYELGPLKAGVTPGHEMAGRVDALGEGVTGLLPGERVAVEPLATCGECDACRAGRDAICRKLIVLGLQRDGGFAESVVVPARRLFRVPEAFDPALAALAEPAAVVVHGLRRGRLAPGQRVLVLGAGTIGLLALVAALDAGAEEVWVSARYDHQAALASRLGAARVLREAEASAPALARLSASQRIDLVLETVGGSADTLRASGAALSPGGTVAVLGVFRGPVEIEPTALLLKEADLVFSNCYDHAGGRADFDAAIALLDRRRGALAELTTHAVPLDEIRRAFALAAEKQRGVVKVTVLP